MKRTIIFAALAACLIAAPLPALQRAASAQATQPAPAKTAKSKKPPSAAQLAEREHIKKCGVEWKEAKAARKVEKGMTWPKYWSACNICLKGADAKKS
jgi:hypothetical protein